MPFSHAGRLVLVRTVLQAMPIYYMATCRIPNSVINEITSINQRFFWRKVEKQRYLAYVAWDKITMPVDMGGLDVRDLQVMNESLLMKFLWCLASGSEAQWVRIVKAKYFPKSELWHSKRDYNYTGFWISMMRLRSILEPWVQWRIGNGESCVVFAQPWFQGALESKPADNTQWHLVVKDLLDFQSEN